MNSERYVAPPFVGEKSNIDIVEVVSGTTASIVPSQSLGMFIVELPIGACLSALKGGFSSADTLALLLMAQNLTIRDLHFQLPRLMRTPNVQNVTQVVGDGFPVLTPDSFADFGIGIGVGIDQHSHMAACIRAGVDSMRHALVLHEKSLWRRVDSVNYADANGCVSVCYAPQDARMELPDRSDISFAQSDHVISDTTRLPVEKLRLGLTAVARWFNTSQQTQGFGRIFVLVAMCHKPALVYYDRSAQTWVCVDPQQSTAATKGMRIGVACGSELTVVCNYLCDEVFGDAFHAHQVQTPVTLATFVVGPGAARVEEGWEDIPWNV